MNHNHLSLNGSSPVLHTHRPRNLDQQSKDNMDIINVLKSSNLSPSEKVSVITELNNKTQPSKNLSHVPCKFFRQGACQAGNSCPFSHANNVSNDSSPCKYFQKGNCKFGIKCALAHILPDGRKVNTRNVVQKRKSRDETLDTPAIMTYYDNHSPNFEYSYQPQQQLVSQAPPPPGTTGSVESVIATSPYQTSSSIWSTSPNSSNVMVSPTQQFASLSDANMRDKLFRSLSMSNPYPFINQPSQQHQHQQYPQYLHSASLGNIKPLRSSNDLELINESFGNLSFNQSAIVDSDEESKIIKEGITEDSEIDFVPSSLNDLLTPQELKRRRSSLNKYDQLMFNKPNQFQNNINNNKIIEDEIQFLMD